MRIETRLVRALAALLIVNSHLEGFYPLPFLAADGLLGDSLFFVLSGLGLVCAARREPIRFAPWYSRRILRIYPSVLVVVFVSPFLLNGGWKSWTAADYPLRFVWATEYGFVHQIMIFYALFFLILRSPDPRLIGRLLMLSFVPYAVVCYRSFDPAIFDPFHWLYYFQLMLFGGWLGSKPKRIGQAGPATFAFLAGVFALYLGLRYGVMCGKLSGSLKLLPYLVLIALVYLMIRGLQTTWLTRNVLERAWIGPLVAMIADATLEIYLIHYSFITIQPLMRLVFPLNVALLLICSVVPALLLARLSQRFRSRIEKLLPLGFARAVPETQGIVAA